MIFVYRCERCGDFEADHRIGKAPKKKKCPECGKLAARCFTPPSIRFNGSGFHVNDYPK